MKKADTPPETKKKLRQIMDSIAEPILGIDANGIIISCNNNTINKMQIDGLSFSSIKKAYDGLNAIFRGNI